MRRRSSPAAACPYDTTSSFFRRLRSRKFVARGKTVVAVPQWNILPGERATVALQKAHPGGWPGKIGYSDSRFLESDNIAYFS